MLAHLKKEKFWHILLKWPRQRSFNVFPWNGIKAQCFAILIAERRSISWGSMFGSVRRKPKPSGQHTFPNQRPIFCVFFVVFYSSRIQCNGQLSTPKLCASFFKYLTWTRPHWEAKPAHATSPIIFSSVTKPLQSWPLWPS